MHPYEPPAFESSGFNCVFCAAYATHSWWTIVLHGTEGQRSQPALRVARCERCRADSVWREDRLLWPEASTAPGPNGDLPEDIATDFREAASIVSRSPRGAAALLRLAIQRLMVALGEPGKDINADIGALVKKGLQPKVQQALDIARVVGNESVHPGTIDLRDDPPTAASLFVLVNEIAYEMITRPREIDEMYNALPAAKLAGIQQRDAGSTRP